MNPQLQFAIELLIKHFVLVASILAGSLLISKRSAAFRHSYWLIGFVWVAALPLLAVRMPVIAVHRDVPVFIHAGGSPILVAPPSHRHGQGTTVAASPQTHLSRIELASPSRQTLAVPAIAWVRLLIPVYLLGLLVGLARVAASVVALRSLGRPGALPSPELAGELSRASCAVGLKRPPRLILNCHVSVPMTFGFWRPVVVVPGDEVSRAVLLHECAHVRRADWLALLLSRFVRCLFWFDPLLLVAERLMTSSSESAADDVVVLSGIAPGEYAAELVGIAARFVGQRRLAGLAIVGGSDLKARVRQILRLTPRTLRVPVRSAALTIALGCLTVLPFAALRLMSRTIDASNDGSFDLGNGNWVRVFAITELRGKSAVSWNMRGQLLPRAVGPARFWIEHPPTDADGKPMRPSQFVVLQTSIPDSAGLSASQDPDSRNAMPFGCEFYPKSDDSIGLGQPIGGGILECFPVSFASHGDLSVYVTAPTSTEWKTAAVATYRAGKLVHTSDSRFFPKTSTPGNDGQIHFAIPTDVLGQPRLCVVASKSSHFEEETWPTPGDAWITDIPSAYGELESVTLQYRAPLRNVLLTHIPTHPNNVAADLAGSVPGIELKEARENRFVFADGQTLSLTGVSNTVGSRRLSWTPEGKPMRPGPFDTDTDSPNPLARKVKLTLAEPGSKLLPKGSFQIAPSMQLYDGSGFAGSQSMMLESGLTYFASTIQCPANPKPEDLVCKIADWSQVKRHRYPIDAVFSEHHFGKSKIDTFVNGRRTGNRLCATFRPQFARDLARAPSASYYSFFDAAGNILADEGSANDGTYIDFDLGKKYSDRARFIEIQSVPYVYIRFPNIAMEPGTVNGELRRAGVRDRSEEAQ